MKTKLLAMVAVVMLLAGSSLRAADESTPLEDAMTALNKALKTVKAQVEDVSKNAESLKLVAEVEKQALIAKGFEPAKTKSLPAAERAKFVAAYRVRMTELMTEVLKLEKALLENKNDAAAASVKMLYEMKTDAHKIFQDDK
jgi:ABC-type transporter MlaC component